MMIDDEQQVVPSCKQSLQRFAQDDRLFTSAALRLPMIDIVSAPIIQTQIRVPRPPKRGRFWALFGPPKRGVLGPFLAPPGGGEKGRKKPIFRKSGISGANLCTPHIKEQKNLSRLGELLNTLRNVPPGAPPGGPPRDPPPGGVPDRWFGAPKRGPQNAGFWRGPGDPSPRFQTRMRQSPSYGSLLAHLVPEELEEREQRSMR